MPSPSTADTRPSLRWGDRLRLRLHPQVTPQALTVFTRQMASLLRSGIPLADALRLVATLSEDIVLRQALADAAHQVQTGHRFGASLRRHPKVFTESYITMVEAGEEAGRLDEILDRLALTQEKLARIRQQIRGAATSPLVIALITLVVVLGLTIFVVPVFETLFAEANIPLPALTQAIVNLSQALRSPWLPVPILLLLLGLKLILDLIQRTPSLRLAIDQATLQLPLVGSLLAKGTTAAMLRVLATMLESGIPLTDALTITSRTVSNRAIRQGLTQARSQIASGGRLSTALTRCRAMPPLLIQLMVVGEQSGDLVTMISRAATIFEEELEVAVKVVTTLLEPMFTASVSIVVGLILIGLYLPLFNLGKVFMKLSGS